MSMDKPRQFKIDKSIKFDENNKVLNKAKLDKPVCIDSKCSKEKKKKRNQNLNVINVVDTKIVMLSYH